MLPPKAHKPGLAPAIPIMYRVPLVSAFRREISRLSTIHYLVLIFGVGLIVRLYERAFVEFYPDIMPILGAETLVFGHGYPFSYIGPIGPAILFAPFSLTLQVLDFAQIVIAIFGSLLACLGYVICKSLLRDNIAGLLASILIATDPFLVYVSRVLWIDSINSVLVISALLLFPYVVRVNRPLALASYNCLLILTLLFKIYNALVLPALVVWALLQWRNQLRLALRNMVLCFSGGLIGLLSYLYFSPVEVNRILTGARGSVQPIIGLKITPVVEALTTLTSYMYDPFTPTRISELSGQGYVNEGLPVEFGLIFLPFVMYGAWSIWKNGGEKNLLIGLVVLMALTVIIFTSFGGFHPRQIMTSRVIMISLFALGATKLIRRVRD